MQLRTGNLMPQPSDLVQFQGELRYIGGDTTLRPAEDAPTVKLLRTKGDERERAFL